MAMHVDGYRVSASDPRPPYELWQRWDGPEENWPLRCRPSFEHYEAPYWNGYMHFTAPHADGECAAHDPNGT